MKEIGSEFWDVPVCAEDNNIFPESTQWFLSGRSALRAIIKEIRVSCKDCHTVAMPSWCCDSMVKPFVDAGVKVHFYPVYFEAKKFVQELRFDCDVLFLMDYFGYTGNALDLADYSGVVIRDVTHSIFSSAYSDADYYFGSLRKWCGVWTGGYAWTKDGRMINVESFVDDCGYTAHREKAMQDKSRYISGVAGADKSYLNMYSDAENILETIGIVRAADRDIEIALKLDAECIKTQRKKNAEVLCRVFSDWLIFREAKENDCPMFVPVLVPAGKRNDLRKYLIDHEIYCPIHWPVSEYHEPDERTEKIYADELSLVCDQRYTEKDMRRMVDIIKEFMKEA